MLTLVTLFLVIFSSSLRSIFYLSYSLLFSSVNLKSRCKQSLVLVITRNLHEHIGDTFHLFSHSIRLILSGYEPRTLRYTSAGTTEQRPAVFEAGANIIVSLSAEDFIQKSLGSLESAASHRRSLGSKRLFKRVDCSSLLRAQARRLLWRYHARSTHEYRVRFHSQARSSYQHCSTL